MRRLIELREQRATSDFERERAEVARLIAGETAKYAPSPAPKPPPEPIYHYDLSPPPTVDDLSHIAHRALEYLLLTRPQYYAGTPWLGKWCTSVIFPVEGGITTVAVAKINAEIPSHARLSAFPVEIPKGTTGANATTPYASLRATLTDGGLQIRFDVTWD
jgi:hypothetical protein